MRAIARQAVKRFAGMEPGRPVGGTYYLYRTLRNLDLDDMLDQLMDQAQEQAQEAGEALTPLEERLERDEFEMPHRRAEAGDRGRDPSPPRGRPRRRGDGQDAAQAAARRRRLHARQPRGDGEPAQGAVPAHPPARRAPGPQAPPRPPGPLDFRRTVRASLSYGGVPAEPKFRHPRPHKPEIFVVADISARWPPSPGSR